MIAHYPNICLLISIIFCAAGRDGLTHNMLNDIHNNWKHAEADKTFGKIIHRHGGLLVLYRGRNYHPKKRPAIPLMLWKPHEPVCPRLIKTTIDSLCVEETKEMRKRGLAVPALTKLVRDSLIMRVPFILNSWKEAFPVIFESSEGFCFPVTFRVTLLAAIGKADPKEISERMGHDSTQTAMSILSSNFDLNKFGDFVRVRFNLDPGPFSGAVVNGCESPEMFLDLLKETLQPDMKRNPTESDPSVIVFSRFQMSKKPFPFPFRC
ncbi:hypothetical protein K7X08_007978 [Anisodus acutangulus]|uniref:Uncharacterized protein n=1 Tax=Anisodus acutangulus TaxID=402998 RepID=A0A9Q1RNQ2_9SOLA|nr:hypothetical protein K7X08_007978 [Anisodus acutangulus]